MLEVVAVSQVSLKKKTTTKFDVCFYIVIHCLCFGFLWQYLVQNYHIKLRMNFSVEWVGETQWNLFIAGIFYCRQLSTTNTFLRNGWNDIQTLMTKPPWSRDRNVDTIMEIFCSVAYGELPLLYSVNW